MLVWFIFTAALISVGAFAAELHVRRRERGRTDPRIDSSAFVSKTVARRALTDVSKCRYESHPFTMYRLMPNQEYPTFRTNAQGFRGNDLGPKLALRIVLVGNSVLWGTGASRDEATIAGCLESSLRSLGLESEVINAGMRSFIAAQELILLQQDIIDLSPDMVIAVDGITDVDVALENGKVGFSPEFFSRRRHNSDPITLRRLLSKWVKKSHLVRAALSVRSNRRKYEGQQVRFPLPDDVADYYAKNVRFMDQICRANGIVFMATLHPTLATKRRPTAEESSIMAAREAEMRGYSDYVKGCYAAMWERLEGLGRTTGMFSLDLSRAFDGIAGTFFIDWTHFPDRGNQVVADAIANAIIRTGLSRKSTGKDA